MKKIDKEKNNSQKPEQNQPEADTQQEDQESESRLSQEIQQELEKLQQENTQMFERLQRLSADYANYQKRVPKQIEDSIVYEREKIVKTLLPVMDNFEHVLANAFSAGGVEDMVKGVKIVYDQMLDILKTHGVEQIQAKDVPFDPARHQAMMRKEEQGVEDNMVLEEFQRGYVMNGRVIRPSKVVVNKAPAQKDDENKQADDNQQD